jgi:hypothetical protein
MVRETGRGPTGTSDENRADIKALEKKTEGLPKEALE